MNNYTAQFTTSITPFFASHQTILNTYLYEESPEPFVSLPISCSAWFAFIRLQKLETYMQCSHCGPNLQIVIADGVSVSFPRHRIASLRSSISTDRSTTLVRIRERKTLQTSYQGSYRVRLQFQKTLEMSVQNEIEILKAAMNKVNLTY